jgi:outer membrane protein assembly factor BamA
MLISLLAAIAWLSSYTPLCSTTAEEWNSDDFDDNSVYIELKGLRGFSLKEFNRVDGFAPTFRVGIRPVEEGQYPDIHLSVTYYIERRRAGWDLSIKKQYEWFSRPFMGVDVFRSTDTNDRWRISDLENSLSAFLFKEDFRNYFEGKGFRCFMELEPIFLHKFRITYADRDIKSLEAGNPFTLFGWAKEFRSNPPVEEGRQRSLTVRWTYDSRDNTRFPRVGWFNSVSFETEPSFFNGDFAYRQFVAHLRRYNIISKGQFLNFRMSIAFSGADLPLNHYFTLGGIGTLRGYPDLSDRGRNFVLGNAEYRFPIRGLKWKPFRIVFNELQGLLFADVGDAWSEDWDIGNLRTDLGLGISGANIFSYFGLYIAQAIEHNHRSPRITVKIERDF